MLEKITFNSILKIGKLASVLRVLWHLSHFVWDPSYARTSSRAIMLAPGEWGDSRRETGAIIRLILVVGI